MLVFLFDPINEEGFEDIKNVVQEHYDRGISVYRSSFSHGLHTVDVLQRCDALLVLEIHRKAFDKSIYKNLSERYSIPVYFETVPVSSAETNYPLQVSEFLTTVLNMYRVHLQKNSDYSSSNILVTGEIGVLTRLWDKVSRLLNLFGFTYTVSNQTFNGMKNPKNEPIDDSLLDLANYAIIWSLLRKGVWGK